MFAGLVNGGKASSRLAITLSRTRSGEGPLISVVESTSSPAVVSLPIKSLKHIAECWEFVLSMSMWLSRAALYSYLPLFLFCFSTSSSGGEERLQMMRWQPALLYLFATVFLDIDTTVPNTSWIIKNNCDVDAKLHSLIKKSSYGA